VNLNHRDTPGLNVRKWIEEDTLDDAKDGCRGADAEREVEDGEKRKGRAVGQPADAVTKVLPQRRHTSHLSHHGNYVEVSALTALDTKKFAGAINSFYVGRFESAAIFNTL
jgi:hypothetical protein